MAALASPKQIAFIDRLYTEREAKSLEELKIDRNAMPGAVASALIEMLLEAPRKKSAPKSEPESGIYTDGTKIMKVYRGQSGRMLAKELEVSGDLAAFDYRGLAERFIKGMHKMSLDEAKSFDAIYGVCCQCGRTLTDENSIEAGIGPVCAGKF